jgi:hypothetical protein
MLSANVGIKSHSASAFGVLSSGILSWALICWQGDWPTTSCFSWNAFTEAACRCASSCEAEFVVSARRNSSALWVICPAGSGVNATCPRRWIVRGELITWPPLPPDLTSMDYYLWQIVSIIYDAFSVTRVYSVALRCGGTRRSTL